MLSPQEALDILIKAVRVAQSKGVYTLEGAEVILSSIHILTNVKERLTKQPISSKEKEPAQK